MFMRVHKHRYRAQIIGKKVLQSLESLPYDFESTRTAHLDVMFSE